MKEVMSYLPLLMPIIIIHLVLMVVALIQILKHKNYKGNSLIVWIVVVVFIQIVGPVIYFLVGRDDEK